MVQSVSSKAMASATVVEEGESGQGESVKVRVDAESPCGCRKLRWIQEG